MRVWKKLAILGCLAGSLLLSPVSSGDIQAATNTLKETYEDDFLIGTVYNPWDQTSAKASIIKEQFQVVTPENLLKPDAVQRNEGIFTFQDADDMMEFCEKEHLFVVGHTFAWNQQTSAWMTETDSKEEAIEHLKTHITTVASRYKGKILAWDVVNEAIRDGARLPANGDWTSCLKEDAWYQAIGPEYIALAFTFAHEADPEATLYYNDYGLNWGQKAEIAAAMFKDLKAQGVPVDGIGMQSHYDTHVSVDDVEASIMRFQKAGAKVSITELDIGVSEAKGQETLTLAQEKEQAKVYAQLFQVYKQHADVIERVTFWGCRDQDSWRRDVFPCLFDENFQKKEAFYAVQDPDWYLATKPPYEDVEDSDWFYDAVFYAYKQKIMTGKDATHFGPDEDLARAQFAVVLWRMEGEPKAAKETVFQDVEQGWYYDAVMWAAEAGIITGYTDGSKTFGPSDKITREQIATMLYRYAKYKQYDVSKTESFDSYPDAKNVQEYARIPMQWAVGNGLVRGVTVNEQAVLSPQGSAVRAQAAILIQRFMEGYDLAN